MNKDRPVLSATVLYRPLKCTFHRCIDYSDIAERSPARRRETRVGDGKQAIFEQNASVSQKRWEIRPKLLLMSIRKLHVCFRLAGRSMTLDDLEVL